MLARENNAEKTGTKIRRKPKINSRSPKKRKEWRGKLDQKPNKPPDAPEKELEKTRTLAREKIRGKNTKNIQGKPRKKIVIAKAKKQGRENWVKNPENKPP